LFVLRGVFAVVRGIFGALMAVVTVFRPTRKEQDDAQEATEEEQVDDSTDPNDPYEILGVKRGVTASELNARYRQLLRVNHPDKVAQLDPEIQAFASERARRIIEAYKELVPEA
jgi:DnaJ-domain-containing protein 1